MKTFFSKVWLGIKTIGRRFKSPVVWASIIAVITIIFNTAGYELADLTTWSTLFDILKTIASSPATIISILVAIFGFINDASSRKNF